MEMNGIDNLSDEDILNMYNDIIERGENVNIAFNSAASCCMGYSGGYCTTNNGKGLAVCTDYSGLRVLIDCPRCK